MELYPKDGFKNRGDPPLIEYKTIIWRSRLFFIDTKLPTRLFFISLKDCFLLPQLAQNCFLLHQNCFLLHQDCFLLHQDCFLFLRVFIYRNKKQFIKQLNYF